MFPLFPQLREQCVCYMKIILKFILLNILVQSHELLLIKNICFNSVTERDTPTYCYLKSLLIIHLAYAIQQPPTSQTNYTLINIHILIYTLIFNLLISTFGYFEEMQKNIVIVKEESRRAHKIVMCSPLYRRRLPQQLADQRNPKIYGSALIPSRPKRKTIIQILPVPPNMCINKDQTNKNRKICFFCP